MRLWRRRSLWVAGATLCLALICAIAEQPPNRAPGMSSGQSVGGDAEDELPAEVLGEAHTSAAPGRQTLTPEDAVVADLFRKGFPALAAFTERCKADPERAHQAYRAFLATHEPEPVPEDPAGVGGWVHILLGHAEACAFVVYQYRATLARSPQEAEDWLNSAARVTGRRGFSWSAYFDMRRITHDRGLAERLDSALSAVPPTLEELQSCEPTTALEYALRGGGWACFSPAADCEDAAALRERAAEAAREDCAVALAESTSADVLTWVGFTELRLGDLDRALMHLSEAVEEDPGSSTALHLRRGAFSKMGRTAEADADRARLGELWAAAEEEKLRTPRGLAEANCVIAGAVASYLDTRAQGKPEPKELERALKVLGDVIRSYPEDSLPRLRRGMFLHELGELTEALADYEAVLGLEPNGAAYVHLLSSKALTALGRDARASQAGVRYESQLREQDPELPVDLPLPERPRLGLDLVQIGRLAQAPHDNAETLAKSLVAEDTDDVIWTHATHGLQYLPEGELLPYVHYLEQATLIDDKVRHQCSAIVMGMLGRLQAESSLPYLMNACMEARSPGRRRAALHALSQYPTALAVPALSRVALACTDDEVRKQAQSFLYMHPEDARRRFWLQLVLNSRRESQIAADSHLAEMDLSGLVLMEIARDEQTDPAIREEAVDIIAKGHPEIARSLRK